MIFTGLVRVDDLHIAYSILCSCTHELCISIWEAGCMWLPELLYTQGKSFWHCVGHTIQCWLSNKQIFGEHYNNWASWLKFHNRQHSSAWLVWYEKLAIFSQNYFESLDEHRACKCILFSSIFFKWLLNCLIL